MNLILKSLTFSLVLLLETVKIIQIKRMAMEKILYSQVIRIRRKGLKFVATDKNKNEAKFKFQVHWQDHNNGSILT